MLKSPKDMIQLLDNCTICPRNCKINRNAGKTGYCKAGADFGIASISVHHGEEPVISGDKGICNVFFSHCNLQCVFCQNYQISRKKCIINVQQLKLEEITDKIISALEKGVENLGFVSPSHMIPQMIQIIRAVNDAGYRPYIVYNTNGYDSVEMLKRLEGIVDVYLPDFKYSDAGLSKKLSDAKDYPDIAVKAIREMYRQKGNQLRLNENGIAESGLIIRHLVLPGETENSKGVLRLIAEEISENVTLSLMSQYNPIPAVAQIKSLNRKLRESEYAEVVAEMEKLGFTKGWVQDFESADFYNPDFESDSPFENP